MKYLIRYSIINDNDEITYETAEFNLIKSIFDESDENYVLIGMYANFNYYVEYNDNVEDFIENNMVYLTHKKFTLKEINYLQDIISNKKQGELIDLDPIIDEMKLIW